MALSGSLKDVSLTELLEMIDSQKKTGVLTVHFGTSSARIFFREGSLLSLDHNTFDVAAPLRFGDKPTKEVYIHSLRVVRTNIQDAVTEMIDFHGGDFVLDTASRMDAPYYLAVPLSLPEIILEAHRLLDEWTLHGRESFPNGTQFVRISDAIHDVKNASALEVQVGELLAERMSLQDLVDKLGRSRYELFPILRSLVNAGVLRVIAAEKTLSPQEAFPPPYTPPSLLKRSPRISSTQLMKPAALKTEDSNGTPADTKLTSFVEWLRTVPEKHELVSEATIAQVLSMVERALEEKKEGYFQPLSLPYWEMYKNYNGLYRLPALRVLGEMLAIALLVGAREEVGTLIANLMKHLPFEMDSECFEEACVIVGRSFIDLEKGEHAEEMDRIVGGYIRVVHPQNPLSPAQKRLALQMLGEIGDESSIPAVARLMENPAFTAKSIATLLTFGAQGIEKLLDILKNTSEKEVRLQILGKLQTLEEFPHELIIQSIEDERWFVRRNMAYLLACMKMEDARQYILRLLKDEHALVRIEAAESLVTVLKGEAEKYLLDHLVEELNGEVRVKLMEYLGEIATETSARRFAIFLKSPSYRRREGDDPELVEMLRILTKIGGDFASKAFVRILEDPHFVRAGDKGRVLLTVLKGIESTHNVHLAPLIEPLMRDRHPTISSTAQRVYNNLLSSSPHKPRALPRA